MASFGEELKRERELRGISLKEIAEATKISIRFLEALEQDKFEMLPGGIFNRGFIRAYARFIGVDGEEMVNAYTEQVATAQAHRREQGRQAPAASPPARNASRAAVFRPPILPKRLAARPLPDVSFAQITRRAREITEGRTSLILWGLALVAFIIGAGVIALSLMRGNGVASPSVDPVAQSATTPTTGAPATNDDALDTDADDGAAVAPPAVADRNAGAADPAPDDEAPEQERREDFRPFVSRPGDQPLRADDAPGPLTTTTTVAGTSAATTPKTHALTVIASEITRVRIECGGRVALFQELWPGQEAALKCEEPVVLSADNAGAVQYSLGGRTSALLGAPGQRVEAATVAPAPRPGTQGER